MKVLQVIPTLNPELGGPIEGAIQQGQALVNRGHSVHIATVDSPNFEVDARVCATSVFSLGPSRFKYAYCPRLASWLNAHAADYDVIVVHGLWQYHGYCVRKAAIRIGVPYVVYVHGMLDPWFGVQYPLKQIKKWLYWPWGEYRVLRDARFALFTTSEELELARHSFWLYRVRERMVGYGIADREISVAKARDVFLARFPKLRDKRIILYLSRIHPKKGCDMLIRSFAAQAAQDCATHLVLAGPEDPELGKRIRIDICDLGLEDRVTLTGMIQGETKWGAYDVADVFILPSHQENFGIVVAEALCSGLPVLTTNKVNIWREIEAWGAGIIEPDTQAGTDLLLKRWFALSAAETREMRRRTRACFKANFEIDLVTSLFEQSLQEAVSRPYGEHTYSRRLPWFISRPDSTH